MTSSTPLVSVVIPIYNVEKYLSACLKSITEQSYKNLEIICVNDASPDKSAEIVKEYAEFDPRIRLVSYEKNRGLFLARLAGADVATGDYICFLDSDDTVSLDWIRLLVKKAIDENSDMVIANTVQVTSNGDHIDNNYMSLCFDRKALEGKHIFDTFMRDRGLNFAWHTVWNKLYSMKLWKKARPEYDAIDTHLIMAEDIVYSLVLFYYAKRMAFSDHDAYFYYRHESASTSSAISPERCKKHISDVSRVFDFFEAFLKKHKIFEEYKEDFEEYKDINFRIQSNLLYSKDLLKKKEFRKLLCNSFGKKEPEFSHSEDFYFYDITTPWQGNCRYGEDLKKMISDTAIKVVSFDMFDTLVMRPFFTPDRLFDFMEAKYSAFLKENNIFDFVKKRTEAEQVCRAKEKIKNPNFEDCTLDEIYTTFSTELAYSADICKKLKQFEEETDLELCRPRKSALELMDFARAYGKKIIITTDTYYEKDFIKKILKKCCITEYDEILVSSELRRLKATGSIYKLISKKYDVSKVLHIGDNWQSDTVNARENGLKARFVPNTREIFLDIHSDNRTSDALITRTDCVFSFAEVSETLKQLPLNAAQAICANNIFDKPFPSWNEELRYNANAYFIGNYVFGTEMLGIASWIANICKENGYKNVVFLARDGYIPKIAFDILVEKRSLGIKSSYFHVSRRALMPFKIEERRNLCALSESIDISRHTITSIIKLLPEYITVSDELISDLKSNEIFVDDALGSIRIFERAMHILNKYFDFEKLANDNAKISKAMKKEFPEGTVAFDLGYSGKIQSLICKAVGRPIDVCFVHSNGFEAANIAEMEHFKIYSYLDYTPKISSIVREYFFSEVAPSCIGYHFKDGVLIPLFDSSKYGYIEHYIQEEIIRGMSRFVSDYCDAFSPYDFMFCFRNEEISLPFETFINQIPTKDVYMFRCCHAEDILYFNYESSSLYDIWLYRLNQRTCVSSESRYISIENSICMTEQFKRMPRFRRAIIMFFCDRKLFWQKFKKNLNELFRKK